MNNFYNSRKESHVISLSTTCLSWALNRTVGFYKDVYSVKLSFFPKIKRSECFEKDMSNSIRSNQHIKFLLPYSHCNIYSTLLMY